MIIFQSDRELTADETDGVLQRMEKAAEHGVLIVPPQWVIHDTGTQMTYRYGQPVTEPEPQPPALSPYVPDLTVQPPPFVELEKSFEGGPSLWERFRAWWRKGGAC